MEERSIKMLLSSFYKSKMIFWLQIFLQHQSKKGDKKMFHVWEREEDTNDIVRLTFDDFSYILAATRFRQNKETQNFERITRKTFRRYTKDDIMYIYTRKFDNSGNLVEEMVHLYDHHGVLEDDLHLLSVRSRVNKSNDDRVISYRGSLDDLKNFIEVLDNLGAYNENRPKEEIYVL